MLIGKRPTDPMFDNELNIVSFTELNSPDHIIHIIDAHLQEECKEFIRAKAEAGNVRGIPVLGVPCASSSFMHASVPKRAN
jgi:hypothetical protein